MTALLLAHATAWWRTHGAAAADAARQLAALDTPENTRIHRADLTGTPREPIRLDGYPEWLRTGQVAVLLRVHADTVCGWATRGLLPATATPGGHHRIHRSTVEQLLNTTTGVAP